MKVVWLDTSSNDEYTNCDPLVKRQLTPKGPMSVDWFLGSLGMLLQRQKHERSAEILKAGGPM
jgi:hypothetical protein